MLVDEGLEILTEDDARALLHEGDVGRVGVTVGGLPAIFPVNYRVVGDAIVFRTAAGTKLRAASGGAVVAFEVDHFDAATRTGWSVLAVGRSTIVAHPSDLPGLGDLRPYADGERPVVIRIDPVFVSGRRIIHPPETSAAG